MKVRVSRTITVPVSAVCSVHYEAGFAGTAPRAHIAVIVAAGAGERFEATSRREDRRQRWRTR